MAKLFKDFKTNYTVTYFVKKDSSGVSYVVLNNGFFEQPTGVIYNEVISLINDNSLNTLFNVEINPSVSISQNIDILNANNLLLNSNTSVNSNSEILSTSIIEINQSISLNQVSEINNNVNLEINQSTNLLTDSNFDEQAGGTVNDGVLYLTDNNIEVNSEKFINLLTELYQSATFENLSLIEYSKQIETQIENNVLFDLFLEAFYYISLSGNTITDFEVLNIIDTVFDLNTNTNIVFSSLTNQLGNSVFEINANILFDGFVFRIDYTKREFVYLKSKITNNKKTLSLITNYKEIFSNLDNEKILKSNITNDYICKSLITNNKKLKSKING